MERKFLFLYLNTGGGHIAPARVLKQAFEELHPGVPVELLHGFSPDDRLARFSYEYCYGLSLNYFRGFFPLLYDLGQFRWMQSIFVFFLNVRIPLYIRSYIKKHHITDVVSFHFLLTASVKKTLRGIPWHVNYTEVVTDPFTCPNAWFYHHDQHFMVYSQELKDYAMRSFQIPDHSIKVIPYLINKKFRMHVSPEQMRALRIKHGFDPDKKIVLLTGGGEGLPGAVEIVKECIRDKARFAVAVVCGRDTVKKRLLDVLSLTHPDIDLHVFGYVTFMDELVKLCDCAVIKSGASTMMEVLANRKPVIICRYIHNQELGNVRFVVRNRVGWFIQKPAHIYAKINEILSDKNFDAEMKSRFDALPIDTDVNKAVAMLMENCWE